MPEPPSQLPGGPWAEWQSGAFIAFPLLGFQRQHAHALFGHVLAVGIVVDDAIVVAEALQHHLEHGLSPREATVKAMKEVSGSVIMIALVLCAVFVPVAFMGGVTGQLISSLLLPSRWLSSSPQSTRSH